MLTMRVKFIAGELTPGLVSGDYNVEEGSTIRELIAECERICGASIPQENFKLMYPMLGGRPALLDSVITKSGTLHLTRVIMGG